MASPGPHHQQGLSRPGPVINAPHPLRTSSLASPISQLRPSYESLTSEYSTLTVNALDRKTQRTRPAPGPAPLSPLIPQVVPHHAPVFSPIRYHAGRHNVQSMAASFGNVPAASSASASEGEADGSGGSGSVETYKGPDIHAPSPPRDRYGRSPFDELSPGRSARRAASRFLPRRSPTSPSVVAASPRTGVPSAAFADPERRDSGDEAADEPRRGRPTTRQRPPREHKAPPVSMANTPSGLPRRRSSLGRMWGTLKRSLSRGRKASITLATTAFAADPRGHANGMPAVAAAGPGEQARKDWGREGRAVEGTGEASETQPERAARQQPHEQLAKRVITLKPNADRTTKFSDFIHAAYTAELDGSPPLPEDVDEIVSPPHQASSRESRPRRPPPCVADDVLHIHPAFRSPAAAAPSGDAVGWRMPRAEAEKRKGEVRPSRPRSPPMKGRALPDPTGKGAGRDEEGSYGQLPADLARAWVALQPRERAGPPIVRTAAAESWEPWEQIHRARLSRGSSPHTTTAPPSGGLPEDIDALFPLQPTEVAPGTYHVRRFFATGRPVHLTLESSSGRAPGEEDIRRFVVEAERLHELDVAGFGPGVVDLEHVEYAGQGGGGGRVSLVVTKRNEVSGDMESWRRGYEGRGADGADEAGRVWEEIERERSGRGGGRGRGGIGATEETAGESQGMEFR